MWPRARSIQRCPQRSSSHAATPRRSISRAASTGHPVYSSTSNRRLQARLCKRNTGFNSATTGGEVQAGPSAGETTVRNFQCILQEVRPGISSERAARWAFNPPRTTTWDGNGMPWGVLFLPSAEQHCGHPSCRIVLPWQQDLSLCGPCCRPGLRPSYGL